MVARYSSTTLWLMLSHPVRSPAGATRRLRLAVVAGTMLAAAPALSQGIQLMGRQGSGPLEINADQSLEWWRDSKSYVATGNAVARRGDVTLSAQKLQAFYAEAEDGGSTVTRIEATGNVLIQSPSEQARGDFGSYDVARGRLELTGNNLRLETPADTVTARDSLVYDEQKLQAVATGQAIARQADRQIHAEILTAHLVDRKGSLVIRRVDADQNVCVQSARTVARGRHGIYNADAGTAVLSGGVEIVQDGNVLRGDVAEVNLRTGISRLRKAPGTTEPAQRRRITATLPMDRAPDAATAAAPAAASAGAAVLPARMRSCR